MKNVWVTQTVEPISATPRPMCRNFADSKVGPVHRRVHQRPVQLVHRVAVADVLADAGDRREQHC